MILNIHHTPHDIEHTPHDVEHAVIHSMILNIHLMIC